MASWLPVSSSKTRAAGASPGQGARTSTRGCGMSGQTCAAARKGFVAEQPALGHAAAHRCQADGARRRQPEMVAQLREGRIRLGHDGGPHDGEPRDGELGWGAAARGLRGDGPREARAAAESTDPAQTAPQAGRQLAQRPLVVLIGLYDSHPQICGVGAPQSLLSRGELSYSWRELNASANRCNACAARQQAWPFARPSTTREAMTHAPDGTPHLCGLWGPRRGGCPT